MACCVVSARYDGLEEWFEMDKEMIKVNSADEAVDVYKRLLTDEGQRRAMGQAARERVLEEHTNRHRAADIVRFVTSV
jgi:spore maturation protein CgeB